MAQRTLAHQAPLSMEFSGREYWSGLPFPSPGDLPNPGIEPRPSTLQVDSLPLSPQGNLTGQQELDRTRGCATWQPTFLREVFGKLSWGV